MPPAGPIRKKKKREHQREGGEWFLTEKGRLITRKNPLPIY